MRADAKVTRHMPHGSTLFRVLFILFSCIFNHNLGLLEVKEDGSGSNIGATRSKSIV